MTLRDEDLLGNAIEIKRKRLQLLSEAPRRRTNALRDQLFSFCIEAIRREKNIQLRPVQVSGAVGLSERRVIEMSTGEGKTLTGVCAAAWHAIIARGCHVMTSNPYLAQRDANLLAPVFERIGLSVGCISPGCEPAERFHAYRQDICFGTVAEMGFDYLRDCLKRGPRNAGHSNLNGFEQDEEIAKADEQTYLHRGFYYALIDEADSVMIDEASTPLIIASEAAAKDAIVHLYKWCNTVARSLTFGSDFGLDPPRLRAFLTKRGASKVILRRKPNLVTGVGSEEILEQVEKSLVARNLLRVDRDYIAADGELVLVSASTGRRLNGRKWQQGLHQAVEAKEGIEPSSETRTTATITIQDYLGLYAHLSGMTGTALPAKAEFKRFYRVSVKKIPSNLPSKRKDFRSRVCRTMAEKLKAIIASADREAKFGRAVLVGTPSVAASEQLAEAMIANGMLFQLLNANQDAEEAKVISQAGVSGAITIATNMAGRGTDIELDSAARAAGGLHVIATEVHSSRRIDSQLAGRCARQGDPGSFELIVSLEDELLLEAKPGLTRHGLKLSSFFKTQRLLEKHASKRRAKMLTYSKKNKARLLDAGLDLQLEYLS